MLRKPGKNLAATVAVLAVLLASALMTGSAAAAGCSRPTLTPPPAVVNGGEVVVAGTACGSGAQIMMRAGGPWKSLGNVQAGAGKRFAKRVKVRVASGVAAVELRAVAGRKASRPVRVKVTDESAPPAKTTAPVITPVPQATPVPPATPAQPTYPVIEHEPIGAPQPPSSEPTPIPTPTPEPAPEEEEEAPLEEVTPTPEPESSTCALAPSTSSSTLLAMAMPSCPRVATDTTAEASPMPFWGSVDCAQASRYATISSGGDEHDTAEGTEQDNTSFRRLTVMNGDNVYGARCELGFNNHERGPTAFYREGDHRVTYFSERLPSNFPINTSKWQTVMQMKQAEPQHDDGSGVALEMQVMNGRWYVLDHWNVVWSAPARTGIWTRFAYDVYYSNNPEKGWLQVSVDLNGDGDFEDPGERSPVIHADTLATEVPGYPRDGIAPGTGIPSHLRIGLYHNPEINCPEPTGCSIDVDNVQVVAP